MVADRPKPPVFGLRLITSKRICPHGQVGGGGTVKLESNRFVKGENLTRSGGTESSVGSNLGFRPSRGKFK